MQKENALTLQNFQHTWRGAVISNVKMPAYFYSKSHPKPFMSKQAFIQCPGFIYRLSIQKILSFTKHPNNKFKQFKYIIISGLWFTIIHLNRLLIKLHLIHQHQFTNCYISVSKNHNYFIWTSHSNVVASLSLNFATSSMLVLRFN